MKKFFAVTGIISGVFLVLGAALLGIGFLCGGKFTPIGLVNGHFVTDYAYQQEYKEIEAFDTIEIDVDAENIEIISGDTYAIEYAVSTDVFSCAVKDGILKISSQNTMKFNITLWSGCYLKIYVPSDESLKYDADISNDAGSITISGVNFDKLSVDCDAGAVRCKNVTAVTVNADLSAGDFEYKGTCSGSFKSELDMGNAEISGFIDCDMDIRADMGSIYVTSYYSYPSYSIDIDVSMGNKAIHDNGGKESDKVNKWNLVCDMGSVDVTFEDEK